MEITYDPAKNERNIRERGLSFERAREFDFDTAEIHPVMHGTEVRLLATGYLESRIHVLVFMELKGKGGIRVISFRKANKREVRDYEKSRRDLEQRT